MNILGIETSCDETSAAVVADGARVLSNVVSSQVAVHQPYGGVVPELASRRHLELIEPVIREALDRAGLGWPALGAVAATYGPGLASSLLIGLNAAKGIAAALGVPLVPVNHLEAHLYSPLLAAARPAADEAVFPMIALVVSGGHTLLALVGGRGQYRVLGRTLDDAAGEAFDKVAKLLGLGYPGGPAIDRLARDGDPAAVAFPRGMLDDPSDDFSFSGLKTAVLYYLRRMNSAPGHGVAAAARREPRPPHGQDHAARAAGVSVADICASFQEAVVDVLVGKTLRAARAHGVGAVSASGGVSLNSRFRQKLAAGCAAAGRQLYLADASLCTDNAAMIAARGYHRLAAGPAAEWSLDVAPSMGLPDLSPRDLKPET